MQYRFFSIPVNDSTGPEAVLNAFLRSHRILAVHRQFVVDGGNSFWQFAVEYLDGTQAPKEPREGKSRVDYQEILSEEEFNRFKKLRELRKETAETEGVPVYAIFTNDQLATMVQQKMTSKAELASLEGVGEAKLKKYADLFLALLATSNR